MAVGMWCVNTNTTARLLGIRRETVWVWCKSGKLRSHVYAGNKLVPLMDVAASLGKTQEELVDVLTEWKLPMWRCWMQ